MPSYLVEEIRAHAHHTLGVVAGSRSQFEASLQHYRRAVIAARQSNLRRLENISLGAIGRVLFMRGDLDGSSRIYHEAMDRARALGDSFTVAHYLLGLHINHYINCDLDAALQALDEGDALVRSIGDVRGLAHSERRRILWLLARGQPVEARAVAERLLLEVELHDLQPMKADCLSNLAIAQMVLGDLPGAQTTLRHALTLPICDEEPRIRLELQSNLALALLAAGDLDGATRMLQSESWLEDLERLGGSELPVNQGISRAGLGRYVIRCDHRRRVGGHSGITVVSLAGGAACSVGR